MHRAGAEFTASRCHRHGLSPFSVLSGAECDFRRWFYRCSLRVRRVVMATARYLTSDQLILLCDKTASGSHHDDCDKHWDKLVRRDAHWLAISDICLSSWATATTKALESQCRIDGQPARRPSRACGCCCLHGLQYSRKVHLRAIILQQRRRARALPMLQMQERSAQCLWETSEAAAKLWKKEHAAANHIEDLTAEENETHKFFEQTQKKKVGAFDIFSDVDLQRAQSAGYKLLCRAFSCAPGIATRSSRSLIALRSTAKIRVTLRVTT